MLCVAAFEDDKRAVVCSPPLCFSPHGAVCLSTQLVPVGSGRAYARQRKALGTSACRASQRNLTPRQVVWHITLRPYAYSAAQARVVDTQYGRLVCSTERRGAVGTASCIRRRICRPIEVVAHFETTTLASWPHNCCRRKAPKNARD